MELSADQLQLHPIINDILNAIRRRFDTVDGERELVEEFVLQNEDIPLLEQKLRDVQNENEKREAILSIFAFAMMVEQEGWSDNAQKIRDLAKNVHGNLYAEIESLINSTLNPPDNFLTTNPIRPVIDTTTTRIGPIGEIIKSPNEIFHPIVFDLISQIQKRYDTIDGEKILIEDYIISDEVILTLKKKLLDVLDETEKRKIIASILGIAFDVENQGWVNNAEKIRNLVKVYGDLYTEIETNFNSVRVQKLIRDIGRVLTSSITTPLSNPTDFDSEIYSKLLESLKNPYPPIVYDLQNKFTTRYEEIDGKQTLVEEFILPDDAIPALKEKLLEIESEDEQRKAISSILYIAEMAELKGEHENAQKIREIATVYGSLSGEMEKHFTNVFQNILKIPFDNKNNSAMDFRPVDEPPSEDIDPDFL